MIDAKCTSNDIYTLGIYKKAMKEQDQALFVTPLDDSRKSLTLESIQDAARLVDTALFKSYMLTAPSLVGSLLRIKNDCDATVVHNALQESKVGLEDLLV